MVKTTVYLEAETVLALRRLAASRRRPQADLIREALTAYTRRAHRVRPKGIGAYHSGRNDVSERARELVRRAVKNRRWP